MTFENESSVKAATAATNVKIGGDSVKLESQRGRVYVGGLPSGVTEEAVTAALSSFGKVVSAIVKDTSAFVAFATANAAADAISAGSVNVGGVDARVEAPRPRRPFNRRFAKTE